MRRVVAIALPQLACEIARAKRGSHKGPLGVILEPDGKSALELDTAAVLDAVSDEARRYGVRTGQKVTEAAALVANLAVSRITYGEIDAALGRVAEIALAFGPTAALRLVRTVETPGESPRTPWGDAPFDTVWLDVTGSAHLVGGEEALLAELEERIGALGHRVRLAIAGGPRLAQALARWAQRSPCLEGDDASAMATLPVQALPLEPETVRFLLQIGVFTVGDLARLPRAKAAARLGPRAAEVLALTMGRDDAPLVPYALPREITETVSFEEGVETTEALLFVLRGMASRAAARMGARGEATTRLEVEIPLDRSIAQLRAVDASITMGASPPNPRSWLLGFHIDLPSALATEADLLRALRAKLERTELFAPAVGVLLRIAQIVPAPQVQLDLSRDRAVDPDSLPALLAELSAEIGPDRVGLLATLDAHRPEATSRLVPVTLEGEARRKRRTQLSLPGLSSRKEDPLPPPSRLLPVPVPLGRVSRGGVVAIPRSSLGTGGDPHLFAIDRFTPLLRLDGVEWWTRSPASRDYMRAWMTSGGSLAEKGKGSAKAASAEALVYVVRRTGEMFLQGWYE
jgi:protein ImuB